MLFREDPAEAVRLFQLSAEHGLPLYSWARERVVEALPALAEARGTPEVVEALKALFLSPAGRGAVLDEMHALGVLGALVPEFGRITAHHQSDLYHVYTVDVHTLRALRRLYALRAGDLVDVEPALGRRMADLADPLPLCLGMLLHDAGKGMGGDHSVRGRELMVTLGERLGLGARQREMAEFLVLHHLTLSHTAQRRDLSDPELIEWFAQTCGDVEKLDALLLLTWADISSVAPGMWTAWRSGLVEELYRKARAVLSGEGGTERRTRERFGEVWRRRFGGPEAERLLGTLPDRYFDSTPVTQAVRHAVLLAAPAAHRWLALLRRTGGAHAEVHLAARTRRGSWRSGAGVLSAHGLDILTARIGSTSDGYALDVFEVGAGQAERWSAPVAKGPGRPPGRGRGATGCARAAGQEAEAQPRPDLAPGGHPGERRQPRLAAFHRGGRAGGGSPGAPPRPRPRALRGVPGDRSRKGGHRGQPGHRLVLRDPQRREAHRAGRGRCAPPTPRGSGAGRLAVRALSGPPACPRTVTLADRS